MVAEFHATSASFDADEPNILVRKKLIEGANGVGAAADTGDNGVGQATFFLLDLFT